MGIRSLIHRWTHARRETPAGETLARRMQEEHIPLPAEWDDHVKQESSKSYLLHAGFVKLYTAKVDGHMLSDGALGILAECDYNLNDDRIFWPLFSRGDLKVLQDHQVKTALADVHRILADFKQQHAEHPLTPEEVDALKARQTEREEEDARRRDFIKAIREEREKCGAPPTERQP
jgi:hypothetical protein